MNNTPDSARRTICLLAAVLLCCIGAWAAPVTVDVAQTRATNFLVRQGLMKASDTLTLYSTNIPTATTDTPCFYIFNMGEQGFVIVSADDRCTPILGYSTRGSFDMERCPSNMRVWLENYAHDIAAGIEANAPANPDHLKEWDELKTCHGSPESPKADTYLVQSTWEQGWGYNNYCPLMDGQHVVVGCVATAMAQIIRYHGYPHRGFGQKSYSHSVYGVQAVDFDTTNYDYTLMPDHIRRSSTAAQRDMVSRLCYHCGVVVNMQYQHSGHPDGSGSYTNRVPDGLKYFGYTSASYYNRSTYNDDDGWCQMIRHEIDNLRPIEYAGVNSEGGHAFVLDGYSSQNRFHFNWGWGGYADGFYTLTTMQGFTSGQEMVINITPSGWEGTLEHFHVSPQGHGDGTSWDQANSDLKSASVLATMTNRDIWMKEGTYYGDTTADFAYSLSGHITILGGFAGDETLSNQRDFYNHPTVIDGMGRRGLLQTRGGGTSSKPFTINGVVLQNGYSHSGNVVELRSSFATRYLTVRDCVSDSGTVLYLYDGLARSICVHNNQAPVICAIEGATVRQSLINNNNGLAAELREGRIINSDIVSNLGTAVSVWRRSSIVNSIIWNNDTSLHFGVEPADSTVQHCAFSDDVDTAWLDSTCFVLDSQNESPQGPNFINPCLTRGIATSNNEPDWQLNRGSCCINAGKRIQESIQDGDIEGHLRCRQGFIDLGCYETNYPVAIPAVASSQPSFSPNPATTHITFQNTADTDVDIFDMTGRSILRTHITPSSPTIDISLLPSGVYFIKAAEHTSKLMKK